MRVRKAHFASFIKQYKGDASNVTEVHSAYLKSIHTNPKAPKSERKRWVPTGFRSTKVEEAYKIAKKLDKNHKDPYAAKYVVRAIEVQRESGVTKKWVALQLKKNKTLA
tara:strand:+ start:815 stop:1141 length:327 start_codon:yes stop_codon:yes gene_type:complete